MQSPILKGEIEPALLPISAAADFLGLSRDSIYRLLRSGTLKAYKHGSKTLISTTSLRDYAASLPQAQIGAETPKTAA